MAKVKQKPTLTVLHKTILSIMIIASISLFIFVPAHFSLTALCIIIFCIVSLQRKTLSQKNKHIYAHLVVAAVLVAFLVGTVVSIAKNNESGCKAILQGEVPCFSYSDGNYLFVEFVGSALVIVSIGAINKRSNRT